MQKSLWNEEPLAAKARPKDFDEFIGQEHILSKGMPLRLAIENDKLYSCILYGPPGSGKTSLAEIIKNKTHNEFKHFSAATQGVGILKPMMKEAEERFNKTGRPTVIFVDEIHRFTKSQQDTLLPYVEEGAVILIGATTENPSFEVNPALLSRCRVFAFKPLSRENILTILKRALKDSKITFSDEALLDIAELSGGDARTALNLAEEALKAATSMNLKEIDDVERLIQKSIPRYRKHADEHYDFISALHKSMRGSDPDAALYYLAAMLEAGEDPLYIARRIVRFASEDVGLADPRALSIAVDAYQATHFIGMPECSTALAEAVVYCSVASKSNAIYKAYNEAANEARNHPFDEVPLMLRNAPTKLMRDLGYSKGYVYPHDTKNAFVLKNYLPERLKGRVFYRPTERGLEAKIKEKLKKLWKDFKK
ncbi:replication-associated recombination protein A [Mesoaciditoga lauensis]|uniref:replication-associated recombination protein A n=1 Tax=Mesoaciditoga lauensis TaxID=1495039 RepID=UPI000566D21C|nr:replication-associated recombination protein A [Mesoaciditoga lauensis]